jgi:hypothetical protein
MITTQPKAIVLVHGAFVDGSGRESMYQILKKDRYDFGAQAH